MNTLTIAEIKRLIPETDHPTEQDWVDFAADIESALMLKNEALNEADN